jgi:hypothetical protein
MLLCYLSLHVCIYQWNGMATSSYILNNGEKNVFRFDDDRSFNSVKNATSLLGNTAGKAFVTPQQFARRHKTAPYLLFYYHLSYAVNYNTFRLAVYLTCFDIYNVIFRGTCFYATN